VRRRGSIAPAGGFLRIDAERQGRVGVSITRLRRGAKVVCGHEIGEDIVAHDGGVLVGARDTVEMPDSVPVVMAQRHPQPRGFDQYVQTAIGFQRCRCHNAIPFEAIAISVLIARYRARRVSMSTPPRITRHGKAAPARCPNAVTGEISDARQRSASAAAYGAV
jgi:hypothetical protein